LGGQKKAPAQLRAGAFKEIPRFDQSILAAAFAFSHLTSKPFEFTS
jgi:hypothetical protein